MAKEVKKFLMVASLAESILNFRSELLSDIQAKGFQIHVAAPSFKNKKHLIKEFSDRNIFVHDIALWRTGFNPFLDLWTIINLWFLMINIRPDYFMGYTVKPVVYGIIAARCAFIKNRIGLITGLGYAFTTSTEGLLVKKLIQNLYRVSLSFATFIFFQNKDDKKLFRELKLVSNLNIVHILNGSGVNLEKFEFCEVPQGPQCFLLIGRLLKAKGIAEYVNAVSALKLEGVNARFLLLGPLDRGPDAISAADLTEWVDTHKIEYLGEVQDVRPIIRECTVMVLPSYREGVPRSVLEAMAMGRPIITTDAPGCRETVIDGVNGFLVSPYSSDELVTAMRHFISEKKLASAMGKNSHIIASEKFDVKKVNEIMIKIMRI